MDWSRVYGITIRQSEKSGITIWFWMYLVWRLFSRADSVLSLGLVYISQLSRSTQLCLNWEPYLPWPQLFLPSLPGSCLTCLCDSVSLSFVLWQLVFTNLCLTLLVFPSLTAPGNNYTFLVHSLWGSRDSRNITSWAFFPKENMYHERCVDMGCLKHTLTLWFSDGLLARNQ